MNRVTAYVHMIQYPAFTNDICFEDEGQCLIYLSPGTLGYLSAHKKMCKEDFNRLKTRTVCMPDLWINFHLHICRKHQIIKVRASSVVMANTSSGSQDPGGGETEMEKPGCPNWELISGMPWTLMSPTERHILSVVSKF